MSEPLSTRIHDLEKGHQALIEKLDMIGDDIKGMIDRAACRDRKLDRVIEKQDAMAPSVEVIRNGLIFIKWGRWLVGGLLALLAWGAGMADWITSHFKFIPKG